MVSRTLLAGILTAASAFAQLSIFPKPSYFREAFRKSDTTVQLDAPVRLKDFVQSGDACQAVVVKASIVAVDTGSDTPPMEPSRYPAQAPSQCLVLPLKDYLALVMSNHTDVRTYYLTLERSQNGVTSAYGAWDPKGSASLKPSWSKSDPRLNDPYGNTSRSVGWPISLGYSQSLPTGQSISIGGSGNKSGKWGGDTNYSSGLNFGVTQPLMKNRGGYITRLPLMQAQSNLRISEYQLRQNLLNFINNAEGVYWNFVSTREQLKVTLTAQDVAKANLDYIRQELALGAVSDLELYRPEQSYANSQVQTLQNQFSLKNQEDALRRQIGADLDPAIRDLAVVLVDSPDLSPSEKIVPDREQTVQKAMNLNPAIKIALQSLDADEFGLASARNGLLPQVDLTAGYGVAGSGQTWVPGNNQTGSPIPGGLGDSLSQLFRFGNPGYNVGLTLTFPIRSRVASMNMANAIIAKKQDALSLRSQQQSLRLNVLQAVNSFEGAIASANMAALAREYAQKDYDAQLLRFKLGMNQQIDLILSSTSLASADQQLVSAQINVRTSLLKLWQQTGELLDQRGIVIK